MALTLSLADAALKEFYLPAVRDQLNNTNWWLAQIEASSQDVEGRRAVLSLHVKRSPGVGARAEGGTLPTAGNQSYAEERVSLKFNYGRIQINGPVIKAMKSDRGSFVRAVESETKRITEDLKRDVNRQLWGTSDGVIATAGTTTASTTVVLAAATTSVQMRQLEVGMKIDIGTTTDVDSVASDREITSVDIAAETFVISGAAVTTSSSHRIYRADLTDGDPAGIELTGLQTIVDDTGTLFNVSSTTFPVWKSKVNGNSGTNRSVSENLFATLMHDVEIESGIMPSGQYCFASSPGVHRAYANLLTSLKRFTGTVELKGGFKGLDVSAGGGSVPFVWERDCPANRAFYLNKDHFKLQVNGDWDFMDQDGAVLNRVANVDAYEASLFRYSEQTTDRRNAHGLIEDLTEA